MAMLASSSGDEPKRADVQTVSEGYQRTRSKVWVREIEQPTRAALDYAAYHANFMNADPEPEAAAAARAATGKSPDASRPFAGRRARAIPRTSI